MVNPITLVLFCLLFVEDIVQDTTIQIKGSTEVPQFYPFVHKSKRHFGNSFAFDAHTVGNNLPDEVHSSPTLACFRKKVKIVSLQKGFPKLTFSLSGISLVLDFAMAMA